jgi:hypothetical protein
MTVLCNDKIILIFYVLFFRTDRQWLVWAVLFKPTERLASKVLVESSHR